VEKKGGKEGREEEKEEATERWCRSHRVTVGLEGRAEGRKKGGICRCLIFLHSGCGGRWEGRKKEGKGPRIRVFASIRRRRLPRGGERENELKRKETEYHRFIAGEKGKVRKRKKKGGGSIEKLCLRRSTASLKRGGGMKKKGRKE